MPLTPTVDGCGVGYRIIVGSGAKVWGSDESVDALDALVYD